MKLTTKKIIAREFLNLTLVITLGIISFLCTFPYNTFKKNQAEKVSIEILEKSKKSDSLILPFKNKLDKKQWFYNEFSNQYGNDTYTMENLWNRLDYLALNDSIIDRWYNSWSKDVIKFNKEIGFSTPEKFQSFIENNHLAKAELLNYNLSKDIIKKNVLLTKKKDQINREVLSENEQIEFGFRVLLVMFIILFLIRYFLYAIMWSFQTLKEK